MGLRRVFAVLDEYLRYLRVATVDANGEVLKHSPVLDRYVENAPASKTTDKFLVAVGVVFGLVFVSALFRRKIRAAWRRHFPQVSVSGVREVVKTVARGSVEWRSGGKVKYKESRSYEA